MSCCDQVRRSAADICAAGRHVSIHRPESKAGPGARSGAHPAAVAAAATAFGDLDAARLVGPQSWDATLHFCDASRPEVALRYLLVLDAMNFCFWPQQGLEYEHLARGLKESVEEDASVLDCTRLAVADARTVARMLRLPAPPPLAEERARFLAEIPAGLERYGGQAVNLVATARRSAAALVDLVVEAFPGFRDQSVYRGRQVFFYKRAQIFVADVWGTFGGRGPGTFHDMAALTMFADYRVPAQLRSMGVLTYSPELSAGVDSRAELAAGSEEEVEIRAATVHAVDLLRQELEGRVPGITSVTLDWWLWEAGERAKDTQLPHHRTLTPYY